MLNSCCLILSRYRELIQNYGTLDAAGTATPTPTTYLAVGAAGTPAFSCCFMAVSLHTSVSICQALEQRATLLSAVAFTILAHSAKPVIVTSLSMYHPHQLTPAGAILKTLRDEQGLAAKSLLVSYENPDVLCQLDATTALALRVVSDRGDGVKKWSLYSTMEPHLKLKAGRRLLRASLLQPLVSEPTIVERQNAIAELISLPDVQVALQDFLRSIPAGVHQCLPALLQAAPVTDTGNPHGRLKAPTGLIHAALKLKTMLAGIQVPFPHILLE